MDQNIPEKWKDLKLEFKEDIKPKTESILKNKSAVNKEKHKSGFDPIFCDNKKVKCIIL
tara:strand:+ start:258 stop:434 length:177 start_codon:yes stop_codon:yes gene_type:complete